QNRPSAHLLGPPFRRAIDQERRRLAAMVVSAIDAEVVEPEALGQPVQDVPLGHLVPRIVLRRANRHAPQLGQRRLPRRAHHRGHGEGRLATESQRPQREPGIRSKAGRRFSLPSPSSSYPFFLLLCALCDSVVSLLPLRPPWCYRAYPARPSEKRSPTVFPRL